MEKQSSDKKVTHNPSVGKTKKQNLKVETNQGSSIKTIAGDLETPITTASTATNFSFSSPSERETIIRKRPSTGSNSCSSKKREIVYDAEELAQEMMIGTPHHKQHYASRKSNELDEHGEMNHHYNFLSSENPTWRTYPLSNHGDKKQKADRKSRKLVNSLHDLYHPLTKQSRKHTPTDPKDEGFEKK